EELRKGGTSVAVVTPLGSRLTSRHFSDVSTTCLSAFASRQCYVRARSAYGSISPFMTDFVGRFGLRRSRARLVQLLQSYCWRQELFSAALRAIKPRVILSLHFMSDPGPLGGIENYRKSGSEVDLVLVQHAVISHKWLTHDFNGADTVFLW